MNKNNSLLTITILSSVIAGNAMATDDAILATINDKTITKQDYSEHVGALPGVAVTAQPFILNNMVNRELVVQEALKQGIDKQEPFLKILEKLKYNALFDFGMQKYFETHPITDERLREEYKNVPALKQYKARHILVRTQEEAAAIISEIKQGASFEQLAAQKSMDPMTRPRGGDLGWLAQEQMFPEVAKIIATMTKGSFTMEPVQTQMGWHVVLLEETRDLPPIPFDAARGQLMAKIRDQQAVEYYTSLKDKGTVQVNLK
jgi:peptidyl-prolyl cis-trans isomerase C